MAQSITQLASSQDRRPGTDTRPERLRLEAPGSRGTQGLVARKKIKALQYLQPATDHHVQLCTALSEGTANGETGAQFQGWPQARCARLNGVTETLREL